LAITACGVARALSTAAYEVDVARCDSEVQQDEERGGDLLDDREMPLAYRPEIASNDDAHDEAASQSDDLSSQVER
jgi:hypothetical protein